MGAYVVLLGFMMAAAVVGVFSQTPLILPSCIEDPIVYKCTVNSSSHSWIICAFCLGLDTTVSRGTPNPTTTDSRFTFMLDNPDVTSGPVISSMSVGSFDGLDGADIACLDSNAIAAPMNITVLVLGAMVNIMLSGFTVTITTMGPSTTILRKTPDDGNCEGMGRGTVLRGENLLSEVLSCGLAGRPVTYCHCSSSGASNTTILPSTLIVNAESTPSSTSDGLSLIVDVNDCAGMEQLRIRVSLDGSSVADTLEMVGNYSRRSSFTFSLLSPENYICHVAIVGDNGVLESRNVSCMIPPPPPTAGGLTNGGGIAIAVAVSTIILFIIAVIVTLIVVYKCLLEPRVPTLIVVGFTENTVELEVLFDKSQRDKAETVTIRDDKKREYDVDRPCKRKCNLVDTTTYSFTAYSKKGCFTRKSKAVEGVHLPEVQKTDITKTSVKFTYIDGQAQGWISANDFAVIYGVDENHLTYRVQGEQDEQVLMENLWPGIEYHYQVVSGATTCAGTFETNSGRTRPAKFKQIMSTKDFAVKRVLQRGGYSEMQLVHFKETKKVIAVARIENNIGLPCSTLFWEKVEESKWIVEMWYAFQDVHHIYMFMDYMPGGNMFRLIYQENEFTEKWAKFYIFELTLALESIHELGYIHRNVRPEKIFIDKNGHLKLINFGTCMKTDETSGEVRALSAGTMDYMSPEVLQLSLDKSIYVNFDECCDWWSVGVILYEMLMKVRPFTGDDDLETFQKVVDHEKTLVFPTEVPISDDSKDLIKKFLTSSDQRLGRNGVGEIKNHTFFKNRMQSPPWKPKLRKKMDTKYYVRQED